MGTITHKAGRVAVGKQQMLLLKILIKIEKKRY